MKIELNVVELYNILTDEEKDEMFKLLSIGKKEEAEAEKYLNSLTPIRDWVKLQRMSNRLRHVLLSYGYDSGILDGESGHTQSFRYLETITVREFFKVRNAGRHSWEEFIKLRGY